MLRKNDKITLACDYHDHDILIMTFRKHTDTPQNLVHTTCTLHKRSTVHKIARYGFQTDLLMFWAIDPKSIPLLDCYGHPKD